MKKYNFGLLVLAFFITQIAFAQSSRLKVANRSFDNLSYVEAIRHYEAYLRSVKNNSLDEKEALTKLAYSYRKVQDTRNSERVYSTLIGKYGNDVASEVYLYYAQSLATNGKYRDSQRMYAKFGEMQQEDMRGRRFTVAYMDNSRFFQDSSQYQIEYVAPLNSRQADFSPMYYKEGLVFVSARDEGGIVKRVFMQNQTPFLDLFQFPDTAQLVRETKVANTQVAAIGGGSATSFGSDEGKEVVKEDDKPLSKVEQFSRTLNTKYHEGPMTFFKDYSKIIFTRNNYNKGRAKTSNEHINKLKLYIASNNGKKWSDVTELPFNNDEFSCGHPALSPDDSKLYFVSDMPGGYGGTDVYVVEYQDGQWGSPVNLGKEINTEGNEMFPYIDERGNMYFSSDGHEGLGGLDIFYVEMKESIPVSDVQNVGAPLNSEKDDFGIITKADRSTGYFSSNRKKGYSDDNIYYFRHACRQLNIFVFDDETKKPIENVDVRLVKDGVNRELYITGTDGKVGTCMASGTDYEFRAYKEGYEANSVSYGTFATSLRNRTDITIYLQKSKKPIIKGIVKAEVNQQPIEGATVTLENQKDGSSVSVVTGADGKYEFQPEKDGNYVVTATKQKYASNTEEIGKVKVKQSKKSSTSYEKELGMVGEGDIFQLDNIYYDLNQFFIRPDAARELEARVIPMLKKYPEMKIEIRSHTDSRASDAYNQKLSQNRARAVVDYLVSRGVNSKRIVAKGYGESELANNCDDTAECNEFQHQQNRRTEFKILALQ